MVAHVLDLLVLDGCALGVGGELFHVGGVLALVLKFLGVHAAASGEVSLEEAVDHHVGVPADGRGEVGVVVEPEAVVADVLGGVYGLCH